ncbi:hypothetical protein BKA70DRAFT_1366611 [Coprinopsis sp. MPI-PUGE-AT-0042]|nr:hypothetical protein BKA70DRAFT_1366611 [Coprinopsis sp. MPI-PUGE-AT-0042]
MASTSSFDQVLLYVWPGLWDLPSFDPYCLAAVLYLQLAIPGKFAVVPCTDVDLSPSGQLPFLVHGQEVTTSYSAIVKYVSSLATTESGRYPHASTEKFSTPVERSQRNAWISHVEASLGDVVASAFYATENWDYGLHKQVASLLPAPQRYFVPQKLRAAYQPRLEAAGLWAHAAPPPDKRSKFDQESMEARKAQAEKPRLAEDKPKFQQKFEKEKMVAKVKSTLDIYARMLEGKHYVFHEKISSIDVAIAARMLLLTRPPFPDTGLQTLVTDAYPELVSHSQRVYDRVLGSNNPSITFKQHSSSAWPSLFPLWRSSALVPKQSSRERTADEIRVDRGRWAFVGLALGTLATYVTVIAIQAYQDKRAEIDALEREREGVDDEEEAEDDIETTTEAATLE